MANRSLIAGAGLLGASKKFNPIGSTIAQSFVDAKGNTSALLRAKKAKINQRTASYIGALNSDVDVTQLDSSQQATVKNYLVEQKQKRNVKHARDPVAHFHLSNGAKLERLNWMADTSDNGVKQSAGMMVNYLYELPHIESRSQSYSADGKVAVSTSVEKQLNL